MATHFSANQYENAFAAQRLQNWQLPCKFKERPAIRDGFTRPISNERGHLLPGVRRSKESPWGAFHGTWHEERDCSRTQHCHILTGTNSREASCFKRETNENRSQSVELTSNKSATDLRERPTSVKDKTVGSPVANLATPPKSPVKQQTPPASPGKLSVANDSRPTSSQSAANNNHKQASVEIDA